MDRKGLERGAWPTRKGRAGRHADLQEKAAERRKSAEEYFALARSARVTADRIVYEEFARRALESAVRLERRVKEDTWGGSFTSAGSARNGQ